MLRPSYTLRTLLILVGLALLWIPVSASAQETVPLQIDVIIAGHDNTGVDARLQSQANKLTSQFANFSSFTLEKSERVNLSDQATSRISLPGGSTAQFTLQSADQGRYSIRIAVPGGQTTFEARKGGMIFVGGPRAPNGTLILLIRVR